jgi:hypothetical protein
MQPAEGETGDDYSKYAIHGPSDDFIANNGVKFQARAEGLPTDEAVWQAPGQPEPR